MDFLVRHLEADLLAARIALAEFIGAAPDRVVFTENSTEAMNVVASSFPLGTNDEVLLTDHEYGAVMRIWQRACRRAGARPPVMATLPRPLTAREQVLEAIFARVTPATRLIVVSHVTSPTALRLPVEELCVEARARGMGVCVDGPHALAQLPLALDRLGCDFYTASCHKWLSAPLGSGFLYVHPRWHGTIVPTRLSWGRLQPAEVQRWDDEFIWSGTRDYSPYLSVPAAIDFLHQVGVERFREATTRLARFAQRRLVELSGRRPWGEPSDPWYSAMAHVPLPPSCPADLQAILCERFGIEVPVISFAGDRFIRVSCHLYNDEEDIERLVWALATILG
jgi:isopenicillin-N epimerase